MDQLRADVLLDLLEGRNQAAGGGRGVVDLHVDLATLAGLTETPGDLAGYGPVIADIARRVADNSRDAEWRWTVTDPDTGELVPGGTTSRRPTASQRRAIQARHRTCVFPGCRMPAIRSDIDHTTPYAQSGVTDPTDMAPLCRHDHCIRHAHGWTYRRLASGGFEWTTRLGQVIVTRGRSP